MTALPEVHWSRKAQPRAQLSKSDEWRTPPWLFAWACLWYGGYTLDAAAAAWNRLCAHFYSKQRNSLLQRWHPRTWCNPPYSRGSKAKFLKHGRQQVLAGLVELVTFLLPHDTADGYWSTYVEGTDGAGRLLKVEKAWSRHGTLIRTTFERLVVEKLELKKRLRYQHADGSASCRPGTARHSSALVTLARPGVLRPLSELPGLEAA